MRHHYQNVDGIAVVGRGAGDEAVVPRVVHRRIKRAVQAEHAELDIVLALIAAALRDFDDHANGFRRVRPGIDI
jgi:hypothetical protein